MASTMSTLFVFVFVFCHVFLFLFPVLRARRSSRGERSPLRQRSGRRAQDAKFKTFGCGSAIASSSYARDAQSASERSGAEPFEWSRGSGSRCSDGSAFCFVFFFFSVLPDGGVDLWICFVGVVDLLRTPAFERQTDGTHRIFNLRHTALPPRSLF